MFMVDIWPIDTVVIVSGVMKHHHSVVPDLHARFPVIGHKYSTPPNRCRGIWNFEVARHQLQLETRSNISLGTLIALVYGKMVTINVGFQGTWCSRRWWVMEFVWISHGIGHAFKMPSKLQKWLQVLRFFNLPMHDNRNLTFSLGWSRQLPIQNRTTCDSLGASL